MSFDALHKNPCCIEPGLYGTSWNAVWAKLAELTRVLKNSFALTPAAPSGLNTLFLKCSGLVSELSWMADQAETYFFNGLSPSTHQGAQGLVTHGPAKYDGWLPTRV